MTERPVLAVSAIVVHDGRLLMVRRGERNAWALPGGRVEAGETLAAAVRREVREETGLRVRPGRLRTFAQRVPRRGGPHYVILAFEASLLGGRLRPGGDAPAAEWVDLAAVFDRPTVPGLRRRLQEAAVVEGATRPAAAPSSTPGSPSARTRRGGRRT